MRLHSPFSKLYPFLSGLALSATLLLSGCGNPQVDAAVDELAETFGGRVAAKAGYATSTKDDELSGKFVEIELSGRTAEIGKAYGGNWALPASYAAFIVYQRAGQQYDFVRVSLKDANEDHTYAFKASDLVTVQGKLSRLNAMFTDMQDGSCEQVYPYINRQAIPLPQFDKSCLALKNFVTQNGLGTFELRSFAFGQDSLNGRVLHAVTLGGTAQHSQTQKQVNYFFTFDTARDTADVVGLDF